MLEETDKAAIVNALKSGATQRTLARKFGVTQQMISHVWREAMGLRKKRRGGDRRSDRYQQRVKKTIERKETHG